MPVSTARSELLGKRLERFSNTLPGVEQGDVQALHRARVASRRLRELLPTLQLKNPAATRKLSKRLRKVTSRLGTVRELDVLILLIDELHESRRERAGALGRVGVAVARERDAARKHASDRLPIHEMHRIARKLAAMAAELEEAEASASRTGDRSWRWVIEARVARRASQLGDALVEAGAVYLPDRLHTARIALKKLRYAGELLAEIGGEPTAKSLRLLGRGQDLLGRMHDIQTLLDRVRQLQASPAAPSLPLWRDLDALVVSLEDDCRRLHARFMRARDGIATLADQWSGVDKASDKERHGARHVEPRPMKAS
jgi:CHAD domain-containing protein